MNNQRRQQFELPEVKQRDTDNEIRNRKANSHIEDRIEFLKSIIDVIRFHVDLY